MKKSPLILPEFIPWETERERFNKAKNRIYKWIDSDPMRLLLKTEGFECRIYQDESRWYAEEFPRIYRFVSEKWDKRNNKERFEVKTCLYSERENALLIDILEDLGFVNAMGICGEPEYLWILGGARMANYDRVFRAKEIADKYGTVKGIFIITAYRMLSPLEKDSVGTYAPDAVTEKDALMASATKIFGLPCGFSVLKKDLDDDPFSSCSVERFNDEYNGIPVTVVQAPSGVRGRRANSRDTLIYLLDN
ncbi:MAG: hypothetical protein IJS94_06530, partial [Clostridia bacterium]|nr:hypothetical protein [Clostridia bacterium]